MVLSSSVLSSEDVFETVILVTALQQMLCDGCENTGGNGAAYMLGQSWVDLVKLHVFISDLSHRVRKGLHDAKLTFHTVQGFSFFFLVLHKSVLG